jgi:O-methyltransferase involved in polyketide biosynthesis
MSVEFTGVRASLLLSVVARAIDYKSRPSMLGDRTANEIVGQLNVDVRPLQVNRGIRLNAAMRARHLDAWVRAFIERHPSCVVVELGCGIDSRAVRVDPPRTMRWYDVDLPDVIELRKRFYAEAPGREMIGADLATTTWIDALPSKVPAIIVADGVQPWLTDQQFRTLLHALVEHFGSGEFVMNGFSRLAARLAPETEVMQRYKVPFPHPGIDDPREVEQYHPRLRFAEVTPFVKSPYVAELSWVWRSMFWFLSFFPVMLREGGRVLRYTF